jgi:leader peptidase (prepilin peptidase)/N-methyltransferase
LLTSALIVLSVIDFRTYEIPLGINIFILALGLIRVLTDIRNWQIYLVGLCAVSIVLAILYYATGGRAIGGGDVKLMAACGLLLGWKLIILAFLLGCVLGAVIHVIRMKVSGESHVLALGPYLSMGVFIAAVWGNSMISWYLGQFI